MVILNKYTLLLHKNTVREEKSVLKELRDPTYWMMAMAIMIGTTVAMLTEEWLKRQFEEQTTVQRWSQAIAGGIVIGVSLFFLGTRHIKIIVPGVVAVGLAFVISNVWSEFSGVAAGVTATPDPTADLRPTPSTHMGYRSPPLGGGYVDAGGHLYLIPK